MVSAEIVMGFPHDNALKEKFDVNFQLVGIVKKPNLP